MNTEKASVYRTFLFSWAGEMRGHRKISYGLSRPLGLSTVGIRSTSKGPSNGIASGLGKCPWKSFQLSNRSKVTLESYVQVLMTTRHKPSAPTVTCNLERGRPCPKGLEAAWRLAGLPLTRCIKYRIWLKNGLVKIKFKSLAGQCKITLLHI